MGYRSDRNRQQPSEPARSTGGRATAAISEALRTAISELAPTNWAADVCDEHLRLVWVSDGLRAILGNPSEEEMGYGEHILAARLRPVWQKRITAEGRREILLRNARYWMYDTPGGRDAFLALVPEDLREVVRSIQPEPPPPVWAWGLPYEEGDVRPVRTAVLCARLHDDTGQRVGTVTVFGPGIPPRLLTMLLRGDEGAFERMLELVEPDRRRTAILFADLESSTLVSRRLSTQRYFELIRELTSRADEIVATHRGLVGKHVGDGITAFFPAHESGSDSAAARAALEAARLIMAAAAEVIAGSTGDPAAKTRGCPMNAAAHWGPDLFIGQLVTGGRLEISALGDEVNQAARIEQAASGGELLASKTLVEQLADEDALALGIATADLQYRLVAEQDMAHQKSVRDAGDIAVVSLPLVPAGPAPASGTGPG